MLKTFTNSLKIPVFQRLLVVVALLHLLLQLTVWLPNHWQRTDRNRDVPVYHLAALASAEGKPLYYPHPEVGPRVPYWEGYTAKHWYLYPPHFAASLVPLATTFEYQEFARLWHLPLLLAFWIYATCLSYLATGGTSFKNILIAGLLLALTPGSMRAMSLGNIDTIMYALFGLALVTKKPGIPLALSTVIKPYTVYFLALSSWRNGRRTWLPALATISAIFVFGVVTCGFDAYVEWFRYTMPVLSQGSFFLPNISLSFLLLRLACWLGWECPLGPLPFWIQTLFTFISIAAPTAAIWFTRKLQPKLQFALVTVIAVLFSPYCLITYLPLILAPLAISWRLVNSSRLESINL